MAGPRIRYPSTPRTPPQERVLGLVLLCLFLAFAVLLVGACNHELTPPPVPTGPGGTAADSGASHDAGHSASGNSGGDGFGGQGGNTSCFNGDTCVQSCSAYVPSGEISGSCDATGAFACPGETVRVSSCAPNACARNTPVCCDETTGVETHPPCGPEGFIEACPAGNRADDTGARCIPVGLGVTNCLDLQEQPCNLALQLCSFDGVYCQCLSTAAGGGLRWQCAILI
jgi:hypothetical protein